MHGVRLIVCGGVHYRRKDHVFSVLDDIHARKHIYLLIHGGGDGIGALAEEWSAKSGVRTETHPIPKWMFHEFGSGCMPRRNAYMITRRPDGVVSFPGGMGTANMVDQAKAARLPVKIIEMPSEPEPPKVRAARGPKIVGDRVIVCGGRNYKNQAHVWSVLDYLHSRDPIGVVIHGGAEGADDAADGWGEFHGVKRQAHPVPAWAWHIFGKSCGPRRNHYMISRCEPQKVIAFPGGAGTSDMCSQAEACGIHVNLIERLTEVQE